MKRVCLAILCALPLASPAQTGIKLKMQRTLTTTPAGSDENVPVFLEADRLQGHSGRETEVEGRVELRRRGQAIDADWLRFDQNLNEVRWMKPENMFRTRTEEYLISGQQQKQDHIIRP